MSQDVYSPPGIGTGNCRLDVVDRDVQLPGVNHVQYPLPGRRSKQLDRQGRCCHDQTKQESGTTVS